MATFTPLLDATENAPGQRPVAIIKDAHSEPVTNEALTDVDAALRAFFTQAPGWLDGLLRLRNAIVSRLGFETGNADKFELPDHFAIGDELGPFAVLDRSQEEIVMGSDDKRFALEISVWLPAGQQRLQVSTRAHPNDAVGRAYLTFIKLPHRLIAPLLTRRMAHG